MCIRDRDYTRLNKFVIRPVHPFPSVSDIVQSIPASSTCFAKLDATHGYFQIPLSSEASKLTTFLLPSGRYRYLRAPMGLSSSSDEWCGHSDRVVGFPWCKKIVDDILIWAHPRSGGASTCSYCKMRSSSHHALPQQIPNIFLLAIRRLHHIR